MAITRNDRDQEWRDGVLVVDTPVTRDITSEAVKTDLHEKGRAYLAAAQTFLAIAGTPTAAQQLAQLRRNTRAISALVRLLPDLRDLLVENSDT